MSLITVRHMQLRGVMNETGMVFMVFNVVLGLCYQHDLAHKIRADKRVVELDLNSHARFQVGWQRFLLIVPEFGPLRVNELAHRATILRKSDPARGMINRLDDTRHCGAHRANRAGGG